MTIQHSYLVHTQGAASASKDSQQATAIMHLISTCVVDSVSHARWVSVHAMQIYACDLKSSQQLRYGA